MIEIMRQNISKALDRVAHPVIWQLVLLGNLLDSASQCTHIAAQHQRINIASCAAGTKV